MIPLRYPVVLGVLTAALGLLAIVATVQAGVALQNQAIIVFDNSQPVAEETLIRYYEQANLAELLRVFPAWPLLAALIAAIAALTLMVLRSRQVLEAGREVSPSD